MQFSVYKMGMLSEKEGREGGRKEERKEGREGEMQEGREGGREGRRKRGREGGEEGRDKRKMDKVKNKGEAGEERKETFY